MNHNEFLYYLCHLSDIRVSISRDTLLLRQLNESEEALIEAFTLRAIRPERITSSTGFDTDRFHIMIQESCDRDKEEIEREKSNILKRIQNQKGSLL